MDGGVPNESKVINREGNKFEISKTNENLIVISGRVPLIPSKMVYSNCAWIVLYLCAREEETVIFLI